MATIKGMGGEEMLPSTKDPASNILMFEVQCIFDRDEALLRFAQIARLACM